MHEPVVSDKPPLISLLRILIMVVLFGWVILGQVFALLAAGLYYDGNLMEAFMNPLGHPEFRDTLLLSQGVAAFTGFIFIPWFYLKISENRSLTIFFKKESNWTQLTVIIMFAVIGLGIALSPVVEWNANIQFPEWMGGFASWVRETEEMAEAMIKSLTSNLSPLTFAFTFIVVAILPAIGEELVFRGLIQTELQRATKNPHTAIIITSVLFSAFHLQFLGFVPRMLIGVFLGYLYFWSGNLWISILGHFFNNGLQLIGLYLFQKGILTFDVESTESAPVPLVVIALLLTLMLLIYLKNYFQSRLSSSRDIPEQIQ